MPTNSKLTSIIEPSLLHKIVGLLRCKEEVFRKDGRPQGGVLVDGFGPGNLFRRLTHHVDDEAETQAVILDLPEDGDHGLRLVLRISLFNAVLPVNNVILCISAKGVYCLVLFLGTVMSKDHTDEIFPLLVAS